MTNIDNKPEAILDRVLEKTGLIPTNNIENEVERVVEKLWKKFKSPLGNSSINARNNSMYDLERFVTDTITSLTEQHQTEKEYMLREFEKVKKLREDEHQREKEAIVNEVLGAVREETPHHFTREYRDTDSMRDRISHKITEIATNHNIHYE